MDSTIISEDLAAAIQLFVKLNDLTSKKDLTDNELAILSQYHQIRSSKKYGDQYTDDWVRDTDEWNQLLTEITI